LGPLSENTHDGHYGQSFERISDGELAKGDPDITDLVLSAKTGWPSRLNSQTVS
jgi:hypothetical protein